MVERVSYLTDDEQDQFESSLAKPMVEFEKFCYDTADSALGDTLTDYIMESNHGGWDGYTLQDLLGIGAFLTDLITYHKNRNK